MTSWGIPLGHESGTSVPLFAPSYSFPLKETFIESLSIEYLSGSPRNEDSHLMPLTPPPPPPPQAARRSTEEAREKEMMLFKIQLILNYHF